MSTEPIKVVCIAHDFPPTSKSIVIEKTTTKILDPDQIRVRVHYACVNFADVLALGGRYQVKTNPPFVAGSEVSGVVEEIGKNVKNITKGSSVVAMAPGAWQTYIDINPSLAIPIAKTTIPDALLQQAAALTVGYSTSHVALFHERYGNTKQGQTVLVLGATGGVGLAAVQLAKLKGCRVIACASTEEKCELAKKVGGADHVINYEQRKSDWFKEVLNLTGGKGADVIYDPVGGGFTLQALKCIAWGGQVKLSVILSY